MQTSSPPTIRSGSRALIAGSTLATALFLLASARGGLTALQLKARDAAVPEPADPALPPSEPADPFANVDRISIRWEDCGDNATSASRELVAAAAATDSPLDDINASVPRPYSGRVVGVRVLHTATSEPSNPPLTLPLGQNMTVIVTTHRDIPTPNGSFFEEVRARETLPTASAFTYARHRHNPYGHPTPPLQTP
jgi:hypothetical protein